MSIAVLIKNVLFYKSFASKGYLNKIKICQPGM